MVAGRCRCLELADVAVGGVREEFGGELSEAGGWGLEGGDGEAGALEGGADSGEVGVGREVLFARVREWVVGEFVVAVGAQGSLGARGSPEGCRFVAVIEGEEKAAGKFAGS